MLEEVRGKKKLVQFWHIELKLLVAHPEVVRWYIF